MNKNRNKIENSKLKKININSKISLIKTLIIQYQIYTLIQYII